MVEIERLSLLEVDFAKIKPEDGPRLQRAFQDIEDKYNLLLEFLKAKFPGEV